MIIALFLKFLNTDSVGVYSENFWYRNLYFISRLLGDFCKKWHIMSFFDLQAAIRTAFTTLPYFRSFFRTRSVLTICREIMKMSIFGQWTLSGISRNTLTSGSPWVPHPPHFNTSVRHKRATPFQPSKYLSSKPKTPRFNTENPSVQHTPQFNTPLSSTSKTPQFQKPISSTPKPLSSTHPSVPTQSVCETEGYLALNWGDWNWGIFGV